MAIKDDIAVDGSGQFYYTGAIHGAAGAGYYTVIEFHRYASDLADDATAAGDDLIDITTDTPSDRSTDNIITILTGYSISDAHGSATDALSEHLYDGTINDSDGTIYDGLVVIASEGMDLQIIQDGVQLANDYWNTIPDGETLKGLNRDVANGYSHRFMLKVNNAGTAIDGQRIIGTTRVTGKTYTEFKINGTSNGNNVLALTYADDLNDTIDTSGYIDVFIDRTDSTTTASGVNSTGQAILNVVNGGLFTAGGFIMVGTDTDEYQILSIATNALTLNHNLAVATTGGETVYDLNIGYTGLDVNNDTTNEFYYAQWDKGAQSVNNFYTRLKYISRGDAANTGYIYGIDAKVFRGITHEVTVSGASSGTFAAVEDLAWGTGATAGTGQMLAIDNVTAASTTTVWIQLLTGVAPSATVTLTGGISSATVTNSGTPTERTISAPFVGVSTGSALIGAYGFALQPADLSASDKVFDLTNSPVTPPNNVVFSVSGLETGEDRVLVGPDTGATVLDVGQFTLNAGITSGAASLVVKLGTETPGTGTNSETDTPGTGSIRVLDDTGVFQRVTYTGVSVAASTMTFSGLTGAPTAAINNNVFISYIDKLADGSSVSYTSVYAADRAVFVRVRDAGTTGDNLAIKTFETGGTVGSAGGSSNAIRTSDE